MRQSIIENVLTTYILSSKNFRCYKRSGYTCKCYQASIVSWLLAMWLTLCLAYNGITLSNN